MAKQSSIADMAPDYRDKALTLKLPDDLMGRVEDELIRRVDAAVAECKDRDDHMRELRDIANCRQEYDFDTGPDACNLVDSMTQELCRMVEASTRRALADKVYLYQATRVEDEDAARNMERWINARLAQSGFQEAVSVAIRNAVQMTGGVLMVDWNEDYERQTAVLLRDKATGVYTPEELRQDGVDYEEVQQFLPMVSNRKGAVYTSPEPFDIYTWPVNVLSLDAASQVFQRVWMSSSDLLLGVQEYGFDEAAVLDALERGPSGSERRERDRDDDPDDAEDEQPYECFRIIGHLPILRDDEGAIDKRLPRELFFRDIEWIVCPQLDLVFRATIRRVVRRPWSIVRAYIRPNSLWGDSVASEVEHLQEAATDLMRSFIDNVHAASEGRWLTQERFKQTVQDQILRGDRVLGIPIGAQVSDFKIDPATVAIALQGLQFIIARAQTDVSAEQASGSLAGPVRKAAEVAFAQGILELKHALVTSNMRFGIEDFEPRITATELAYMSPEGDRTRVAPGKDVAATQELLRSRFKVVAQLSTENINQQTRINRVLAVLEEYRQSALYKVQISTGDVSGEYYLMSMLFAYMGINEPEVVLGSEENAIQTAKMLVGAAAAMSGAPSAGAVPPSSAAPSPIDGSGMPTQTMPGAMQ